MKYVVVTGSRSWKDAKRVQDAVKWAVSEFGGTDGTDVTIVHGGARGADLMVDVVCRLNDVPVIERLANWGSGASFNRAAGTERNERMLTEFQPECVIAFWDGESRGTKDCMDRASQKQIRVVHVKPIEPEVKIEEADF